MLSIENYSVLFSQRGDTHLHSASANGQTAVVSLLLDHGADAHAKGSVSICLYPSETKVLYIHFLGVLIVLISVCLHFCCHAT